MRGGHKGRVDLAMRHPGQGSVAPANHRALYDEQGTFLEHSDLRADAPVLASITAQRLERVAMHFGVWTRPQKGLSPHELLAHHESVRVCVCMRVCVCVCVSAYMCVSPTH